jgi:PAS domain S-box-containing protein
MNSMASQQASCSALNAHPEEKLDLGALWLYERALAATSCGIVISDAHRPNNPIIYCNQAFLEITGYSRDEVIGRNCRFLQGPDTDQEAIEQIRQAIRVGQECEVVLKNYRKDGTFFWNSLTISPVRDANGCLTHFIGVQTDITRRKQAEETRQLMQFSIERSADAAFYIRPDGGFWYVNEAACRLLGYSREELLAMSIHDIDPEFDAEVWARHWQGVKQCGSFTLESQHQTIDKRVFPVEISFNYLEFNDEEYNCAFVRDISDRKLAEAALRKSEKQYRTLAKNFPNGAVLLFDRDLRYLIAEGVELATIGLSKESVEGKTLWEAFSPEVCEAFSPAYRAALAGETTTFEFAYANQFYLVYTVPVTNEDGEISAGMVMTQNITERKLAEKALQRSNALLKAQQEADLDGVLVIDEKGAIASYNQRFCEMWQMPESLLHSGDQKTVLNFVLPFIAQPQRVFSQMEYLEENPNLISRDEIPLHNGSVYERYSAPVNSPKGEFYGRIWSFRDITERKQTEQGLRQQATREQLLAGMNQRIRQTLNLNEVLNTAVAEVRQFLNCDRVVIYRFHPDWSGTIDVESVGEEWTPSLGTVIEDTCFKKNKASYYQQGRIRAFNDIYNAGLTPCHIALLEQFQVRASLVVPILQGENLWGLLIAYQCSGARQWKQSSIELLRQLSVQLGIAIQQAALFKQVADELTERKAAEAALRISETKLRKQATQLKKALQELKQAQIQLIQTEKMSSLGQLVAGVAHEINNPITFIYGNLGHADKYAHELLELVDLYTKHYPQPVREIEDLMEFIDFDFLVEDFPKLLSSMNMGVNRILQIVHSLKNFSRLDEAERKLVDIHEGIENSLLILQHRLKPRTFNIEVVKEYGNLPPVECYPGQLNQVFMNLLNNAIDALEKYGSAAGGDSVQQERNSSYNAIIKISTEVVDRSEAGALAGEPSQNSKSVVIRIADNGPGIPKEVKKRIFDPFFTTKSVGQGTGLGLSISYQIVVEKHGGQLRCISEPRKGTEFIVEIPIAPPDSSAKTTVFPNQVTEPES